MEDPGTSSATRRSSLFSLSLWLGRTAGRASGARPGPSISQSGKIYCMQNVKENGTENKFCFLIFLPILHLL